MKRIFRPGVVALEERKLLSSTIHHPAGGGLVESMTRPHSPSVGGTLTGIFAYNAGHQGDTATGGLGPLSYQLRLDFEGGQLDKVKMGGFAYFNSNGQSFSGYSDFYLGKYRAGVPGSANERVDHLELNLIAPPFPPSLTFPSSAQFLVQIDAANGAFKRDVGEVLDVTLVPSNVVNLNNSQSNIPGNSWADFEGNFTATFQPRGV